MGREVNEHVFSNMLRSHSIGICAPILESATKSRRGQGCQPRTVTRMTLFTDRSCQGALIHLGLSRIDKANFSYGEEFHTELNGGL